MTRQAKASSAQPAVRLSRGGAPFAVFLVLIVAALVFGAASAAAKEVHVLSKSFGAGELALGSQSGVALNQENGEVYVADTGDSRVAKFTAAGVADGNLATSAAPTFIAVDNSSGPSKGDIYVVDSSDNSITKLDPLGLPVSGWGTAGRLEGLGEIAGIAVDSSGDLWAYNSEAIMRELSGSSGTKLTEWNSGFGVSQRGIAVDSSTNLYVVRGSTEVAQFTDAGALLHEAFGGVAENGSPPPATSLAVDEAADDVYLGNESSVARATASSALVETFGQVGAGVHYASGVSVVAATGDVYVANAETDNLSVFSFENIEPPAATIAPPAPAARTAHFSGHINPNAPIGNPPSYDVTWQFECRSDPKDPFGTGPCPGAQGQLSADSSEHLIEGTAEGLEPHTHYEAILTAKNAGNTVKTAPVGFTTLPDKPFAKSGFAWNITDTEATLNATVIPNGAETTYHFDYVPKGAYEAEGGFGSPQTLSTPEEGLPPVDNTGHAVSTRVTELAVHTAYVYRVVATNSVGSVFWPTQEEEGEGLVASFVTQAAPPAPQTDCPNQAFREFAGASLPDCRAYEQASPVDKGGLNIEGFMDLLAASPDGSSVSFYSGGGTGIPASAGGHQDFTTLLSSRQGESWSTQRLLPPEELGDKAGFIGASQDLRYALVEATRSQDSPRSSALFMIDASDSSITQIVPYKNQGGGQAGGYGYDGISADGSRVFFETRNQLTPNAAAERDNLYVWDRASGEVVLVGVLPGAAEEAPPGGSFGGAYSWLVEPDTSQGGSLRGLYVEALHAISPDGDQAYFTAGETGQLYLRRGLTGSSPTTIHVSAPEAGVTDPNGPHPAAFQEATPDGSRAFFLSSEKLTTNATTGEFDEGKDLYRYDAETGMIVDVTPDSNSNDFNGAEVQGLLGASADGSSGYFAARAVLAPGGIPGENNIYRFSEEGGNFTLTFVAHVEGSFLHSGSPLRNWSPQSNVEPLIDPENFVAKTSRVSADGQSLLFWSGLAGGLYVYSAGDKSLNCISCVTTGETPIEDAQPIATGTLNAYLLPTSLIAGRLTRAMSADGSRVFFQTADSLVAADTNGGAGCTFRVNNPAIGRFGPECMDVYEWEAPGAPGGSCHEAEVNGGCIYLLSSGKSRDTSNFIDASTDGSTAFIATTSQLVPTDKDELYDIYGVRTDGGLASQHAIPATPCASGEACHGASSKAPDVSSPGSSSFQGPGNPKSAKAKAKKCKKSTHNNCAKKKQKKKHHKKGAKRPNATTKKAGGSK